MTTLQLRRSLSRSPLRFAFRLIPLALAIFTSPVDAATREAPRGPDQISKTHKIVFDEFVPCVQEIVHLEGPIRVSLKFNGLDLTGTEVFIDFGKDGISGYDKITRRNYSAIPNSTMLSSDYKVRSEGSRRVEGRGQLVVKFLVVGNRRGSPGNHVEFYAKQVVGLKRVRSSSGAAGTVDVDFEPLEVCK